MVKFTVPFPVPLPGVTLVIQLAPLAAVQAHPGVAGVVTGMAVPGPPAAATDWVVGLIEYEHPAACWLTVKVCPATVSVPVRGVPAGLAAIGEVHGAVPGAAARRDVGDPAGAARRGPGAPGRRGDRNGGPSAAAGQPLTGRLG